MASDVNGEFKLELPESDGMVLVVNFIGMVSQEIPHSVTRDVNLKIVLKMADTALDDVVVNGFTRRIKTRSRFHDHREGKSWYRHPART